MNAFWKSLTSRAQISLVAGSALVVLFVAVSGWWLLRPDYQVLFANLKPQDLSAMAVELEKLKIPFKVADEGDAILVDKRAVHETRIKLMGKELSLHGAVGFELFNNTDFGMTEFAQKINYQRALQGELTRTIQALAEVQDVRVHLALPEQGLFKQSTSKAKAAVTLTMRQGQVLRAEQVKGIGRLVAAAVPGMASQDVTIADNQGVVLSRNSAESELDASSTRLDLKRESDNYLTRKATEVLDRAFGAGQALVSVDVTLNMDQVRVTKEEVLGAPSSGRGEQPVTGVVVRERESSADRGGPLDMKGASHTSTGTTIRGSAASSSSQREIEYQVGRRVEQVVSQPGSIRRIHAVAVIRQALTPSQIGQVEKMLAAAVGASAERGDDVVVQTLEAYSNAANVGADMPAGLSTGRTAPQAPIGSAQNAAPSADGSSVLSFLGKLPVLVAAASVILLAAFLVLRTGGAYQGRLTLRSKAGKAPEQTDQSPLSAAQREATLQQIQRWMRQGDAAGGQKPGGKTGTAQP
jgi:flagellar M-ring protein FliF